jgi:hypothetical protein
MCEFLIIGKQFACKHSGYSLLEEINKMAEQKIDPNRPKDDQATGGTTFQPVATPPVNEKGEVLPLGPETLEKQREGFQKAEQQTTQEENPLEVKGVEADLQNAEQNPSQSGPASYTKEDVKKQGEEVKSGLEEQTEEVKSEQAQSKEGDQKVARPATDTVSSMDVSKAGVNQGTVKATEVEPPKAGEPPQANDVGDVKNAVQDKPKRGRPRKNQ